MEYQIEEYLTIRLTHDMKKWLGKEADRQCANMSVVVRQAIKLLQEQKEEENKNVKSKTIQHDESGKGRNRV